MGNILMYNRSSIWSGSWGSGCGRWARFHIPVGSILGIRNHSIYTWASWTGLATGALSSGTPGMPAYRPKTSLSAASQASGISGVIGGVRNRHKVRLIMTIIFMYNKGFEKAKNLDIWAELGA